MKTHNMLFLLAMALTATGSAPVKTQQPLLDRLLAELADGDLEALEKLYTQTKTAVYGFALSILKHPQQAEDVMQDAYVRLYQSAGSYRPMGKPMAWILTIVRNLCLMKLRERRGEPDLGPPGEAGWDLPDPEDFTESSIDRMVLRAALTTLSDEERQIVILHSVSGLRHREIAALLDIPLSTVLSKYHRALPKLRKVIAKEEA